MKSIRGIVRAFATASAGTRTASLVLVIVVALGMLALAPTASAQPPPTMPTPSDMCTATLTLNPTTVAFAGQRAVDLSASGFEPGALYSVFVGGRYFGGGIISSDGTGATSIVVDALVAATPEVQVATNGRCAVATLTIVGPLRVGCEPMIIDGFVNVCPLERL
jgi:hypothetical protein